MTVTVLIIQGSISHVDQHGLIINLTKYVNGFVPIIHNADIPIKEILNKFPLKKKVLCRVRRCSEPIVRLLTAILLGLPR